jgi:hypothetical protein
MNEVVNKGNIVQIGEKVAADEIISPEDINLFVGGLNRMITEKAEYSGKTVGEIIDMQKAFTRENLGESVKSGMVRIALNANHEFKLDGIIPYDTLDTYVTYFRYTLTNTSDKDIKNLNGSLAFYNQAGTLVKNYPLKTEVVLKDEVIKAGESKTLNMPFNYDPESPRDVTIRNQFQQLRPVWQATLIEFTDGETISVQKPGEKTTEAK